jgi:hypothetical protein
MLAQVARHVTSQLRGRTLAQVFTAWRTWAAGSSWRRQVEDHLSGKHQFMVGGSCMACVNGAILNQTC